MSGFRSGGRVPVSQPQRRIYPSLDPAPHCPHLALATPAGPHLLAMPSAGVPLSFIPPLCPQNTSNSPRQCPAWRKRGLCIRWHSTNWMRSWPLLSRPSAQVRVLGLVAWHPWASTDPKDSLPLSRALILTTAPSQVMTGLLSCLLDPALCSGRNLSGLRKTTDPT